MKTTAIFYTDSKFRGREISLISELDSLGFDNIIPYRREEIENTLFYHQNKEILDSERGNGFWLWKPYIISEAIKNINEGDFIFYIDAGDKINQEKFPSTIFLDELKEYMSNNECLLTIYPASKPHKYYTKRDCFVLMNCDTEIYYNYKQIEAGIIAFKKSDFTQNLLNEWLKYSKNKNLITDSPSIHGRELSTLIEHRHDQSILGLLGIKHNIIPTGFLTKYLIMHYYYSETYRNIKKI